MTIKTSIPWAWLGFLLPFFQDASALPAFARRYEVSCLACHMGAYPRLNAFGLQFKKNGYQFPEGAEDPARAGKTLEPGTIAERLNLFKEPPLSVRVQNEVVVNRKLPDPPQVGDNRVDFNFPSQIFLAGGGSMYRNVSAWMSLSLYPLVHLHIMNFGIHNLLGEGWLNIRGGKFLLTDFKRPSHRRLSRLNPSSPGPEPEMVMVGLTPFMLDMHQIGFDVWGQPGWGPVFYRIAVVNGGQPMLESRDMDDFKDVYARISYTIRQRHTWGAFGYNGNSVDREPKTGFTYLFRDHFVIAGMDLELDFGRVVPYASLAAARHDNPDRTGAHVRYYEGIGELNLFPARNVVAILGYRRVVSGDKRSLEMHALIGHVTYLFLTNFKLGLEYDADLRDSGRDRLFGLAEMAF